MNEGHEKEVERQLSLEGEAYLAGYDCAVNQGRMKSNPHLGGSQLWWTWHNGYKDRKQIEALDARSRERSYSQK